MPHPDKIGSAIPVADAHRGKLTHAPAAAPSARARRSTDALEFRHREAVLDLSNDRAELAAGLNAPHASIASKYFYDALGSQLFVAITHLPEYYLTRAEAAIFARDIDDIARVTGSGHTLIDLGAGNGEKAASLFRALKPARYLAVDISAGYLKIALDRLRLQFPEVSMTSLELDMTTGLVLPDSIPAAKRLFFYPGSSIGNFAPADAAGFLADLHRQCQQQGGLLIGVDMVKDKAILDVAYDDALGLTAAFNLNALNNVNSVLGSNFDVRDWRHCGFFNKALSRTEMHVEARLTVEVRWPGGARRFEAGERIHTENSYKYSIEEFTDLLHHAGFRSIKVWTDQRDWFALFYASA